MTRHTTRFSVPFVAGLQRPRASVVAGHAHVHDTQANRERRAAVACAYREAHGPLASRGTPVSVAVDAARALPKSRPRSCGEEPDVARPDIDNVCKLVLDALNGVAWDDDSQVVSLTATKRPRVRGASDETVVTVSWEVE